MFVRAGDLRTQIEPGDAVEYGDPEFMWEEKEQESAMPGSSMSAHRADRYGDNPSLIDSIRERGVEEPAVIGMGMGLRGNDIIWDGHHRVAAANQINPNSLVPVTYESTDRHEHPGVIAEPTKRD